MIKKLRVDLQLDNDPPRPLLSVWTDGEEKMTDVAISVELWTAIIDAVEAAAPEALGIKIGIQERIVTVTSEIQQKIDTVEAVQDSRRQLLEQWQAITPPP